jgi:osmotically-inducible protein OsmY
MMLRKSTALLTGLGAALGAGVMYLLDPGTGRRRRAVLRDKLGRYGRETGRVTAATSKDLWNRTRGAAYITRKRVQGERVPDGVLVDRVRSAMGHVIEDPTGVTVTASGGHVTLAGKVRQEEIDRLLAKVSSLTGVAGVESRLTPGELH